MAKIGWWFALLLLLGLGGFFIYRSRTSSITYLTPNASPVLTPTITITPSPSASPTATPTPKPLTFSQMNALYGPCASLPVLMYHHIQDAATAKKNNNTNLTVTPETFESHLAYLNSKGYTSIDPGQLIAFFDQATPLPKKPILLTFDDGYDDFATYAAPLLSQYNTKASMFLSTGLVENSGYLSWNSVSSLVNQGVYFGNHTWSHRSMNANLETDKTEIATAQTQLENHGLNGLKIFAYPFGTISKQAISFLSQSGYQLAFTTVPGRVQCQRQRLTLPRIRIGNAPLSVFGL